MAYSLCMVHVVHIIHSAHCVYLVYIGHTSALHTFFANLHISVNVIIECVHVLHCAQRVEVTQCGGSMQCHATIYTCITQQCAIKCTLQAMDAIPTECTFYTVHTFSTLHALCKFGLVSRDYY